MNTLRLRSETCLIPAHEERLNSRVHPAVELGIIKVHFYVFALQCEGLQWLGSGHPGSLT